MTSKPKLVAVLPDQQAPYYDPALHDTVLAWLEANRPDKLILSGDLVDLPMVSRHPLKKHELNATIEDSLTVTQRLLREYRDAAGSKCKDKWLVPGNHEHRLQAWVLKNCPEFAQVTDEQGEILTLPRLLRLNAYGYQWCADPIYGEDYPNGHVTLTPTLAVYHGHLARKGAGASALATLNQLNHSVIVGHTHRQALVHRTTHTLSGQLDTMIGVEAGTLARVRGGLGYAVNPDWQNGFATVRVYPDDTFSISLATYQNGVLTWEGQRYGDSPAHSIISFPALAQAA